MLRGRMLCWIISGLLVVAFTRVATAEIRHVDGTNRNCNSHGPGNIDQPWCRISDAGKATQAGDTVLVHAGTYREQMRLMVSGRANQPIVFKPFSTEKVVVDGQKIKLDEEGLLHIEKQAHLIVSGFKFIQSTFYGMKISGASDILLENNEVTASRNGGIIVDELSSNVRVIKNDVHHVNVAGPDKAIHESITISNVKNFLVAHNHVHHSYKEGIDAKDGSSHGEIRDNHVEYLAKVGVYLNHATKVRVFRNRIHHCGYSGIQLAVGDYAMGAKITEENDVFHNLVWKNGFDGVQFWQEKRGRLGKNRIFNNVFYRNGHSGILLEATKDNLISNNIISGNKQHGIAGEAIKNNKISHNLFFRNRYNEAIGENNVSSDPKFIDAERGNFKLKNNSPAIDRGIKLELNFAGRAPDLGVWEWGLK